MLSYRDGAHERRLDFTMTVCRTGIRPLLEPGRRFHAEVNIGADSDDQLFFVSWESG